MQDVKMTDQVYSRA